ALEKKRNEKKKKTVTQRREPQKKQTKKRKLRENRLGPRKVCTMYCRKNKRKTLTLNEKTHIIELSEQGKSVQKIVDQLGVGKILSGERGDLKLKNIKLQFFPPNTTSQLQLVDQDIIQALKLKYRKCQLSYMTREMDKDKCATGTDIMKKVNLLDTVFWESKAWDEMGSETIRKCFVNSGFSDGKNISDGQDSTNELDRVSQELFGCNCGGILETNRQMAVGDSDTID
uniref:DDE-1 domain-containing protein n=1 Tax=Latimeria chalumnae TaxID=7897 RepID=H3APK1_LATCH